MREIKWETELSKDWRKHLEKLGKRSSLRIRDELEELGKTENSTFHKDVRPLTGKLKEFYRLRIGDLRVIFEIDWKRKESASWRYRQGETPIDLFHPFQEIFHIHFPDGSFRTCLDPSLGVIGDPFSIW